MRAMRMRCSVIAIGVLLGLWPAAAEAYDTYSVAGDATNCRTCHGDFGAAAYTSLVDGMAWGNLHNLHRTTMLSGDCTTCHSGGGFFPVSISSSTGGSGGLPAISCMGCHGRAGDDVAANPSFPAMGGYGAGLRRHHWTSGVTACGACHADADPAAYAPVAESAMPPYYGMALATHPAMPTDACNPAGEEDYVGAALGLDNDGDGLYDTADSDCAPAGCGDGVVAVGEDCDTGGQTATCDADCTFVVCGDGAFNAAAGEECDLGVLNSDTAPDACRTTCTLAACGDAVVDTGEACDTGAANSDTTPDACRTTCVNASCGDNVVDSTETCDPVASCPTTCDDGDVCTTDTLTGDGTMCTAVCTNIPGTVCANGDGCCPVGCDSSNDDDCATAPDAGVVDAGPGAADARPGVDAAIIEPTDDGGCSCRTASRTPAGGAALLIALLPLTMLIRRRSHSQRRRR